jgi:hypothetical protein
MTPAKRYDAFISYSHRSDLAIAKALRDGLQSFAKTWYRPRALRIFLDQSSLSADSSLGSRIEAALRDSRFLLLIASPEAAGSVWVAREVEWWLANRSVENILLAVTDGELAWSESDGDFHWADSCGLPHLLRGRFRNEPMYADLRWGRAEARLTLQSQRFRSAVLDLAAPLHGIPKDELDGEDLRQHRRLRLAGWLVAALLAVFAVVSGVTAFAAFKNAHQAEAARKAERSSRLAAEQSAESEKAATVVATSAKKQAEERREEAVQQRGVAEGQARIAESRLLATRAALVERAAVIPSSRCDRNAAPTRRARSRSAAPAPPTASPLLVRSRVQINAASGPAARPRPRSSATPPCPGRVAPAPRSAYTRR